MYNCIRQAICQLISCQPKRTTSNRAYEKTFLAFHAVSCKHRSIQYRLYSEPVIPLDWSCSLCHTIKHILGRPHGHLGNIVRLGHLSKNLVFNAFGARYSFFNFPLNLYFFSIVYNMLFYVIPESSKIHHFLVNYKEKISS